jgi:hypothetical protein
MEVNCCFLVAHQPSSEGEKELFTRKITKMPATSRTKKTTQEMLIVVFPPMHIRPEYLQDHRKRRLWYQFRIISSFLTALWMAMFCCASADCDWVEHTSSTRTIV